MKGLTKDEAVEIALTYGVTGAQLAKEWGFTRQWLYSPRRSPLPEVFRYALIPTLESIGTPPNGDHEHHAVRHLHITIEEED